MLYTTFDRCTALGGGTVYLSGMHAHGVVNSISTTVNTHTDNITDLSSKVKTENEERGKEILRLDDLITTETNERVEFQNATTPVLQDLTAKLKKIKQIAQLQEKALAGLQQNLPKADEVNLVKSQLVHERVKVDELQKQLALSNQAMKQIKEELEKANKKNAALELELKKVMIASEQDRNELFDTKNSMADLKNLVENKLQELQEIAKVKEIENEKKVARLDRKITKLEDSNSELSIESAKVHRSNTNSLSVKSSTAASKSEGGNSQKIKAHLSKVSSSFQ